MRRIDGDENRHDAGCGRPQQDPRLGDRRERRRADIRAGRIAKIDELEAALEILAAAVVAGVIGQGERTADGIGPTRRGPVWRWPILAGWTSCRASCSSSNHSMTNLPGGNRARGGGNVVSFNKT
jgi:hypothetical protein